MKKLLFLLSVILITGMTGCEKDPIDDPIVNPIITHTDLGGQWNFVKFEYKNKVYSEELGNKCEDYPNYGTQNIDYGSGDIEDWDFDYDNGGVTITQKCGTSSPYTECYELKGNEIHLINCINENILEKYEIIEYTNNGNIKEIKLKKISREDGSYQTGGILTLQKQ